MAFLGNLVRSFFTADVPPESAVEVNIAHYINIPIVAREEGLILYGPTQEGKYELVLQRPIEDSARTAISIFRLTNQQSAQERFVRLREVLIPLSTSDARHEVFNVRGLQEVLDLLRVNHTWQAAHLAAKLGYAHWFKLPSVARTCNSAELELHQTPLHIAVQEQHVPVIKALLAHGVSLDMVDVKGNSVYHLAAQSNSVIIEMVMQAPRTVLLDAPNHAGKTPLHLACQANKPDCVTALLAAGADVNVAATHDSSLAIHTAMSADSATCAKEILRRHPNMLHVQDMKMGGTPLHWAKSKKMIIALVELQCQVNARNFEARTALHLMAGHGRLGCVVALLSHGARPDMQDSEGNTALHLATSLAVVQALVVFQAPLNITNKQGETARHHIASSNYPEKAAMLHALHAVGAARCQSHTSTCCSGCSSVGSNDGVPPKGLEETKERQRSNYDAFLDDAMNGLMDDTDLQRGGGTSGGRMLCLDGGGIRGLVLIVLLRAVQRAAGDKPITRLFDWIAGTSTGAILALAVALGRSPEYCLSLYFKLKDEVFQGIRPYSEKPLEDILKNEFGESTVMADIKGVKVVVTGVLADRYPADLHMFRNYSGGEQLLNIKESPPTQKGSLSPSSPGPAAFVPTQSAEQQLVWMAARASGAAPSYFRAYGRFIDGGLIANNPSLDLLTEVTERNAVLRALGRHQDTARPSVLLSLGTGRPPVEQVNAIDFFKPESLYGTLQMAFGLSNMAKLLIDQATMADNHAVDRCRAWCSTAGVRFVRLSPQLSADIPLDETKDEVLLAMLWETMVYCNTKKDKLSKLANFLNNGDRTF